MSSLSSRSVIPLRTWSPFPLSASHLRFQVREKSRTSEPRPTSRPSEWPSHSPWCAIPFAPGVRFHCRSVTCASRCERRVAPRSPAPRAGPLSGHPTLPGARFLFAPGVRSRCRPVTCASRCVRKVAPRSPTPRPSPPCGLPFLPGARFPSHLESVHAVGQSLALPGA